VLWSALSLVLLTGISIPDAVGVLHRGEALRVAGERICAGDALAEFYLRRDLEAAWTESASADLMEFLASLESEGLRPADYHLAALERGVDADSRDLLLTDAYLLVASHLVRGRVDPETMVPTWCLPSRDADLPAALQSALAKDEIGESLRSLVAPHEGYARLRAALASYRAMAASGGWASIDEGPPLKPGSTGPRVEALMARLRATGDLDAPAVSFDSAVVAAVRRYQRRHGLDDDGVAGTATQRSMNVPVEERIRQIELNLERWRWLPQTLGSRYALLNIAAFEMEVVDVGPVMSMRVIVGKEFQKTPVFSSQIERIVFSPYWNVPDSIAAKEIEPAVRRNPGYLASEHMERVPGGGYRQKPGPWNALGGVKFDLPNRYLVYLHDTPAKELFDRPARAFSHGCMRIEKPLDLAAYLLRDQPEWTADRIRAAAAAGRELWVKVRSPLPVHVLYWTAWAGASGTVHFRDDVYHRDGVLLEAMKRPPK
jgi:L,D-transpeptidase YcbB